MGAEFAEQIKEEAFESLVGSSEEEGGGDDVARVSDRVGMRAKDVLYRERFGFKEYRITGVDEAELNKWKREISQIQKALMSGDREILAFFMDNGRDVSKRVDSVLKILRSEKMNKRKILILAIGIWCLREKSRPPSGWKSFKKLYGGGEYSISNFLDEHGDATCIDLAVLIKELADSFGIEGGLYNFGMVKSAHLVWIGKGGEVLDVMEFDERAGYFGDVKDFREASIKCSRFGLYEVMTQEPYFNYANFR